ncbi:MAG: hypothetical protein ACRDG4_14290 [Chloroflexota bacterium]
MNRLKAQHSSQARVPEQPTSRHRLTLRSLAAMNAAREAVMRGRVFERDAAEIVRDLREEPPTPDCGPEE